MQSIVYGVPIMIMYMTGTSVSFFFVDEDTCEWMKLLRIGISAHLRSRSRCGLYLLAQYP